MPAPAAQDVQDGQGHGGVVELVLPQQRQVKPGQAGPVEGLAVQRVGDGTEGVEIRHRQRSARSPAAGSHHLFHRRRAGVQHRMAAGLDDAGLGGGDGLHCAAEKRGMVQPDIGEGGHLRSGDDVGGVKFAAHAHLADHHVTVMAGEPGQADGRDQLELRRVIGHAVRQGLYFRYKSAEVIIGDRDAVDLHPLVEAADIGGGVEAGPVPGSLEDGGGHGTGAAFAVCSCNVDILYGALRVAQLVKQRVDAGQAGNAAPPVHPVDIVQCFVKRHDGHAPLFSSGAAQGRGRSCGAAAIPRRCR